MNHLYRTFNDTFWKKVDKYGKHKMAYDVEILKNIYQECEKDPQESVDINHHTLINVKNMILIKYC